MQWLQTAVTSTPAPVFQGSGPASIAAYAATLRALPAGGSIMGTYFTEICLLKRIPNLRAGQTVRLEKIFKTYLQFLKFVLSYKYGCLFETPD